MQKLLLLLSIFTCQHAFSQQLEFQSWDHDGLTREYLQYVPSSYDGGEAVPLVIALHGLGDTIESFSNVGFQDVADTANFIVVYPEAIVFEYEFSGFLFPVGTAWNSGAGAEVPVVGTVYPNENVDDVGFLNALMDTMSSQYNIDQNKIFVTGFSMGAFMTNRLACELTDRVAACASVAATIPEALSCNPSEAIPMCAIHGTADATVGYGTDGGGLNDSDFGMTVNEWIAFWSSSNNCSGIVLEGSFPDISNDGLTVDYVEYGNCSSNSRTVHYKVNGAEHWWLNSASGADIDYTAEIWKFFLGLSPTNLSTVGIEKPEVQTIAIYPNPTSDFIRLENLESKILNVSIFNATGQLVKEVPTITNTINVSDLKQGLYRMMIATEDDIYSNSFIKN